MSVMPDDRSQMEPASSLSASSLSMGLDLIAFGEIDGLIERLERQASELGIDSVKLDELMNGFIADQGECLFDRNHQEELAVELLRVWMELAYAEFGTISVLDAMGQLSGIEISSAGVQLLEFECARLHQSVSRSRIAPCKYPEPNTIWGEFLLLGILGEGAISRVFLARQDSMSGRLVTLKVTSRETSESKLLARIQHSGVVPVYSVHEHQGLFGICMPFVGSSTLADFCEQGSRSINRQEIAKADTVSSVRGAETHASWLYKFSRRSESGLASWIFQELANHLRRRQTLVSTWIRASGFTEVGADTSGTINHPESNPVNASVEITESSACAADRPTEKHDQRMMDNAKSVDSGLQDKWWESHSDVVDEIKGYDFHGFILRVGVQLASALSHVHRSGVVHCDVKPSNILIGWDAQPRLLDFNVSQQRASVGGQGHHVNQLVGGTPGYMAPEQREAMIQSGEFTPDARVDVFSLGAVLFELLAGCRPPLGSTDRWSELKKILAKPELSISQGLQAVLIKSLAYRPEDRYQTANEFGEDLSCVLDDRPLVHIPEPSKVEAFNKWRRRHPRLSSGGSIAMLGASMIFMVAFWGWSQHKEQQATQRDLAVNQLQLDLPVAASLMSAIQEYDDLRPVLSHKMQRVHANLKLLAEHDLSKSDVIEKRYASIGPQLGRLLQLWRSQTSKSGAMLSSVYQVPDPESDGYFCRDDLSMLAGGLGLQDSGVSEQFEELFARGQFSESIAYAESHPEQFEDYGRLILFAHSLFRTKQYLRASNAYSEAIANEQSFPLAVFYRGVTQLALGEHHQASLDFRKVLESHPDFVSAQFNLGIALMHQDRVQEADREFSKVVKLDPDATQALIARAKARMQLKKLGEARSDIARALSSNPTDARNLIGLSQLLSSQDPKRALLLAEQAVERSPNDLDARQMLAHLLTAADREQESLVHLTHILKMDPNHSLALGGRAVLSARFGHQADASGDLNKLIGQDTKDPLLCYQIACGFSLLADARDPSLGGEVSVEAPGDSSVLPTNSSKDQKDHLRQAMSWYQKAVTADPSIRSLAATDSDLEGLRGSEDFMRFERLHDDIEALSNRFRN